MFLWCELKTVTYRAPPTRIYFILVHCKQILRQGLANVMRSKWGEIQVPCSANQIWNDIWQQFFNDIKEWYLHISLSGPCCCFCFTYGRRCPGWHAFWLGQLWRTTTTAGVPWEVAAVSVLFGDCFCQVEFVCVSSPKFNTWVYRWKNLTFPQKNIYII